MWLLLALLVLPLAGGDVFTLGYLTGSQRRPGDQEYVRPGLSISGAISLAVAELNAGPMGARGHRLQFLVAETRGEELASIARTADLWTQNVAAYIGPQETCVTEARMAAAFNLPMISYFCMDYQTSDKSRYPTFARTRPPDTQISKSVVSVLLNFQWTQVAFFYLNSTDSEFLKIGATILQALQAADITVRIVRCWSTAYYHVQGYKDNPFLQLVRDTYEDTRIYVILGHQDEHLGLMIAMEEMKLFDKGEYWVVGVDTEQYDPANPEKYLKALLWDETNPVAQRAFRSYLGVVPSPPVGFETFSEQVNHYMEQPPFNFPNPLTYVGAYKTIRAEAAYLYDAVNLYAQAVLDLVDRNQDPRNGTAVINAIKGRNYRSAMGYMVYMDQNGDAEGNYTLLARKSHHIYPQQYGLYPVGVFTLKKNDNRLLDLQLTDSIEWVSGRPPIAEPPCGFRGEKCITHTGEIAAGVAGGLMLFLAVVLLVLYRNWRYEQELDSLLWKVDYRDIQINEDQQPHSNASLSTKITRAIQPLIRTSQVSLSSNPDADFRYSTIYTQIGIYKGRIFAIKKVGKKSVDITRDMKKELKMMRDLRHDNLNAFIGACTDPPNICIVTEYCPRGSLKDILDNEDVKLDNMFIASLVGDIIRGMTYLHDSPVRVHGNLKTSNCLVDSRWVVKLADFGLHQFKREDYSSSCALTCGLLQTIEPHQLQQVASKCEGLLYRAPELLRANQLDPLCAVTGTQKGDVYSFAIILYELHARHGPFGDPDIPPTEILLRVVRPEPGQAPFRPQLELLENSFDFVRDCLVECWAENPEDRPDFKTIRTKLRPLRKGMKPNIFDNMMAMMEKYANNLEALVDERTDQLVEEKKKTEALLYEMLPRYVAEQLKRGNKVEAESFDCVTIYFSDIVGFTTMSAESTPLQVVDFLNDLYTCFDSTIENYDVYKVETIGDAYMVVSGLPIRNGIQHAGEIASMSLQLLEAVKRFPIRHRPTDSLMLRIGIHSGPVCAGVVGLKMPRYCLFGDTVNTASRMESSGIPLKIHCSSDCKALLDQVGGYTLAERGLVPLKGKGEQRTFWLLGEDPVHRQRRAEERARVGLKTRTLPDSNGYLCGVGPRSSLKSKSSACPPLARCSSLESPKRLRFASGNLLELHRYQRDPMLEAIADNSPCKKNAPHLLDAERCSSSCPCIKVLPSSVNSKNNSFPVLFPTVCSSAPASPGSGSVNLVYSTSVAQSDEGSFLIDELNKPLLEVTGEAGDVTDIETPV